MQVFIIDTSNMDPVLQCGVIGVVGSSNPTKAEKEECLEVVARYLMDGWAIAGDPSTPIGWLAALTAETARVPFVNVARLALENASPRTAPV